MNRAHPVSIITASLLAIGLAASSALADSGNNRNKGHRAEIGFVGPCPPGLAKKNPPCIPPGHAKKRSDGWDDDDWHHYDGRYYRLRIGDHLGDQRYHIISRPDRYGLPIWQDGSRYVIVDDRILRIDPYTLRILALGSIVNRILD